MIRAPGGFERRFDDALEAVSWNRAHPVAGAVVYREKDGVALTRPLGAKFSEKPFTSK